MDVLGWPHRSLQVSRKTSSGDSETLLLHGSVVDPHPGDDLVRVVRLGGVAEFDLSDLASTRPLFGLILDFRRHPIPDGV
jgi:hypothetical protein